MEEIAPQVYWFHPPTGGEVYWVRTEEGVVLIDSGYACFRPQLLSELRVSGCDPATIVLAIATHLHCDHVGGLGWWQQEFGFPVLAHANDTEAIQTGDPIKTAAEVSYTTHHAEFIPCPVARRVTGGEILVFGGKRFMIIHAPGHTPGSIIIRHGDLLFSGDVIFETGGIGWVDVHWGSNPEDYVETLDALRAEIGTRLCPGHGAPFILTNDILQAAHDAAAFYIPHEHGYGTPRAPRAKRG